MPFQRNHILIAVAFAIFLGGATGAYILLNNGDNPSSIEAPKEEKVVAQATPKKIETQNKEEAAMSEKGQGNALTWALAISLCFSILLTIYLLKWRLNIPNGQVSIVPDELLKELGNQKDSLIKNTKTLKNYVESSDYYQKSTQQQLAELQKAFSIFQGSLDSKDQEIDRDVQALARHSSLQMTQRYIEADVEAQKKVVQLI